MWYCLKDMNWWYRLLLLCLVQGLDDEWSEEEDQEALTIYEGKRRNRISGEEMMTSLIRYCNVYQTSELVWNRYVWENDIGFLAFLQTLKQKTLFVQTSFDSRGRSRERTDHSPGASTSTSPGTPVCPPAGSVHHVLCRHKDPWRGLCSCKFLIF